MMDGLQAPVTHKELKDALNTLKTELKADILAAVNAARLGQQQQAEQDENYETNTWMYFLFMIRRHKGNDGSSADVKKIKLQ